MANGIGILLAYRNGCQFMEKFEIQFSPFKILTCNFSHFMQQNYKQQIIKVPRSLDCTYLTEIWSINLPPGKTGGTRPKVRISLLTQLCSCNWQGLRSRSSLNIIHCKDPHDSFSQHAHAECRVWANATRQRATVDYI